MTQNPIGGRNDLFDDEDDKIAASPPPPPPLFLRSERKTDSDVTELNLDEYEDSNTGSRPCKTLLTE